jgi:hypothetical protein
MRGPRGTLGVAAVAVAVSLGVSAPALGAAGAGGGQRPAARPAASLPAVTLTAAQAAITVDRTGQQTFVDPGIFAVARGAPLRFNVRRSSLTGPVRLTRVIHGPGGSVREVPLPSSLAAGFRGLRNFAVLTVRDSAGKVVATRHMLFCPDVFDPQRAGTGSAPGTPFPQNGCSGMPFTKSMVWGLQRGWGADSTEFGNTSFNLALGTYTMTETITATFRKVLDLPAATSTATVSVTVKKGPAGPVGEGRRHRTSGTLPRLPKVRTMTSPPRAALPDMVPLPSWGIQLQVKHKKNGHPAVDHINFNSTVAISGNSQLDVQGFRTGDGPQLHAFQYFFLHGKVIGRAPAGTMVFDNAENEQEWHFQQFAQYRLLDASKNSAVLSHKEAFCIAPTDAYDLLRPGATWQPPFFGLGGNCGQATALWVQEQLPLGWGDTYSQSLDGQNFNVTSLPNGTYYIQVIANPEKVLHETNMDNNTSLRKIILGGTPNHRTLRVPPITG